MHRDPVHEWYCLLAKPIIIHKWMTPDIDGFWPIHERFICTLSIRMGVNRASEIVGLERWYFAWLIRMQIVSTWNPMRMLPGVQAVKRSFVQSMDIRPWMGKLSDWRAKNIFEIGKEQKGNYLYLEAQFVSDTRGEESPSRRWFFFFFVKFYLYM